MERSGAVRVAILVLDWVCMKRSRRFLLSLPFPFLVIQKSFWKSPVFWPRRDKSSASIMPTLYHEYQLIFSRAQLQVD